MSRSSDVRPHRRTHVARDGMALLGGLAFGVLGALGIGWAGDRNDADAIMFTPDERSVTVGFFGDLGPGAATPLEAIEGFLDAEIANDPAKSLALLARSDRQSTLTINSWERTRRTRIGVLLGYSPVEVDTSAASGTAVATTTLELLPSLNLINGLTPPSSAAEWHLINDGGWRVDVGASVLAADHLAATDLDDVEEVALAWLGDGSACDPLTAAGENATFRNSTPPLTERLCALHQSARPVVGPITELSSAQASRGLTAAFGSSIRDWAVVVPTFEPAAADLVFAPVGDRWVVIDVISR